ncbi:TetR/AcrR family transcriptional regulator [Halolamina pelagica]|uniref:TetR/AcrR family transcriptional regulator n=1 Tax=Halolamina pelagica TaxID=699431 RepID=UPI001187371C|nr:TetR/AcrR family transcriptional regulator [Halolamina pelagica]
MGETPPFLANPETTRESIMRATYLALCEHGYAGLTIQRIGECFEKSKSLLYHHYDDKDELLLAFLQFMLEEHESSVPETDDDGPRERLGAVVDAMLPPNSPRSTVGSPPRWSNSGPRPPTTSATGSSSPSTTERSRTTWST